MSSLSPIPFLTTPEFPRKTPSPSFDHVSPSRSHSPSFGNDALMRSPISSSSKSQRQMKTIEERLLDEYGLDLQQLEKSQGQSVLPHVIPALKMINDPSSTYTLPQMLFLVKKLLTWFSISAAAVKGYFFQQHATSLLHKIQSMLVEDVHISSSSSSSSSDKEEPFSLEHSKANPLEDRALILQKIGFNLTLLLSYYCEEVPAFMEQIQPELLEVIKEIIRLKLPLADFHIPEDEKEEVDEDNSNPVNTRGQEGKENEREAFPQPSPSSLNSTPHRPTNPHSPSPFPHNPPAESTNKQESIASIRTETLYLLIRCLPLLVEKEQDLQELSSLYLQLTQHSLSYRAISLCEECLHRLHQISLLLQQQHSPHHSSSFFTEHFPSLLSLIDQDSCSTIRLHSLTILRQCSSSFFSLETNPHLPSHLGPLLKHFGMLPEMLVVFEQVLEENSPHKLVELIPHLPLFLQQLSQPISDSSDPPTSSTTHPNPSTSSPRGHILIFNLFISLAMVTVQPFLHHLSAIFSVAFLHPFLFIPLCKWSAVMGKHGGQMIAIEILKELGKVARSGLIAADPAAQSALLEAFHIIKDHTGYSNLLSAETLAVLESFARHHPVAFEQIEQWQVGKACKRGTELKKFLVSAGTVYSTASSNSSSDRGGCASCGLLALGGGSGEKRGKVAIDPSPSPAMVTATTNIASNNTTTTSKRMIKKKKVAAISPSPFSQDLAISTTSSYGRSKTELVGTSTNKDNNNNNNNDNSHNNPTNNSHGEEEEEEEEAKPAAATSLKSIPEDHVHPPFDGLAVANPSSNNNNSSSKSNKLSSDPISTATAIIPVDYALATPQIENTTPSIPNNDNNNNTATDNNTDNGMISMRPHQPQPSSSSLLLLHQQERAEKIAIRSSETTDQSHQNPNTTTTNSSNSNAAHDIPVVSSSAHHFLSNWFPSTNTNHSNTTSSSHSTAKKQQKKANNAKIGIEENTSDDNPPVRDDKAIVGSSRPETAPTVTSNPPLLQE